MYTVKDVGPFSFASHHTLVDRQNEAPWSPRLLPVRSSSASRESFRAREGLDEPRARTSSSRESFRECIDGDACEAREGRDFMEGCDCAEDSFGLPISVSALSDALGVSRPDGWRGARLNGEVGSLPTKLSRCERSIDEVESLGGLEPLRWSSAHELRLARPKGDGDVGSSTKLTWLRDLASPQRNGGSSLSTAFPVGRPPNDGRLDLRLRLASVPPPEGPSSRWESRGAAPSIRSSSQLVYLRVVAFDFEDQTNTIGYRGFRVQMTSVRTSRTRGTRLHPRMMLQARLSLCTPWLVAGRHRLARCSAAYSRRPAQ